MYKYAAAEVWMRGNKPSVSFYAYSNDAYGLHRVADWDDSNVLWYDTEEEAKGMAHNSNDCVISRWFEK